MPCAIKFRTEENTALSWIDELQGEQQLSITNDFVLKRKDGLYAYQLAVVADDIAQNISHVVRGIDLLESTPMQLAIYKAVGKQAPKFAHFPVITETNGQKLSKQNLSRAIDDQKASANLRWVASILGIQIPTNIQTCQAILETMLTSWPCSVLQNSQAILAPGAYQR